MPSRLRVRRAHLIAAFAALLARSSASAATSEALPELLPTPVEVSAPLAVPAMGLSPAAAPSNEELALPADVTVAAALPAAQPIAHADLSATPATTAGSAAAQPVGQRLGAAIEQGRTFGEIYDASKPAAATALAAPVANIAPEPPIEIELPHGRLPDSVRPKSYDVKVALDKAVESFRGEVRIAVVVEKATDRVILHALDMRIESVKINGVAVPKNALALDEKTETLTIALPEALKAGEAAIEIAYSAKLNKQMRGFYQSKASHEGVEENYAYTQLEATDARRFFPSFDEPRFKATFKLTATVPERLTAISNMPVVSETRADGMKTVSFAETPKMSTYLVALAVGRLMAAKSGKAGATDVTVWVNPKDAGQADFALEVAQASLKWYGEYFDLPYLLPKMDLVGVPDFAASAMENWGAVFYRDSALLVHPELTSIRARRRPAVVVSHENVHQWNGNAVTMNGWEDLWLNEAFATWLAYKFLAQWKPEWLMWQEFEQEKGSPLFVDSLKNTRPIASEASSSAEIEAQFDSLTYEKGGAILRMIENFIGERAFRDGMRLYMRRHKYGNAAAADLWSALEETSGQPVSRIAKDWLTQPGYPLVSARSTDKDGVITLSQRRFLMDGDRSDKRLWSVPVVLRYEDETGVHSHRVVLDQAEMTVTLPAHGPVKWVYQNQDGSGFYRSGLDAPLLERILKAPADRLDPVESLNMMRDLWALARTGDVSMGRFLDYLSHVKTSRSRLVLETAAGYLETLSSDFVAPADRPLFQKIVSRQLTPHWKRLGWSRGGDDETKLARAALVSTLGDIVRPMSLLTQARRRLKLYLRDPARVESTLVGPLLLLGAKAGGGPLFSAYRGALRAAKTPEQRDQFLRALGSFDDPARARDALALTLTADVRGQDVSKIIAATLRNPKTRGEAWTFIKTHWPQLREKGGVKETDKIVDALWNLQSTAWLADIRAFFADPKNVEPSAEKTLAQALEAIELGIKFRKAQAGAVSAWLRAASPN